MASLAQTYSTGLVLGKFNPLTAGHQYLIETALSRCRTLFIAISGKPDEAIPQHVRANWIRQLYPKAIVVENPQHLPYSPDECTSEEAFYNQWLPEWHRVCRGRSPDALFTSESYGPITAQYLNCLHVSVDPQREKFPISATMIRENPFRHWQFMHPIVRAHFVKTVTLLGPESTGKTTLCQQLAQHFNTTWQPEWARDYLGDRHCNHTDMEVIARGHAAAHAALLPAANKILFQDTNAITTKIFSEHYYNSCPAPVEKLADATAQTAALLLLTDIDIPWQPDTSRDLGTPALRQQLLEKHRAELHRLKLPFTFIQGTGEARLHSAIKAVENLLPPECLPPRPSPPQSLNTPAGSAIYPGAPPASSPSTHPQTAP